MKCAQFFSTPNRCRVIVLLVWAKPPKLLFSLNTFNYIIIIIFNLLPLLEICAPISPRVFDVQTQNLAKILDRHQEEVLWFLQQIRPTDFEECGVKGPIFPSQNTLRHFKIAISPRVFIRSSQNCICLLSRVPFKTIQVYRALALKTPEVDFSPQLIHQTFRTSYLLEFSTDPLQVLYTNSLGHHQRPQKFLELQKDQLSNKRKFIFPHR